jgi:hypothetical protein
MDNTFSIHFTNDPLRSAACRSRLFFLGFFFSNFDPIFTYLYCGPLYRIRRRRRRRRRHRNRGRKAVAGGEQARLASPHSTAAQASRGSALRCRCTGLAIPTSRLRPLLALASPPSAPALPCPALRSHAQRLLSMPVPSTPPMGWPIARIILICPR